MGTSCHADQKLLLLGVALLRNCTQQSQSAILQVQYKPYLLVLNVPAGVHPAWLMTQSLACLLGLWQGVGVLLQASAAGSTFYDSN